jgi:predicted nucleic acid-binding protein
MRLLLDTSVLIDVLRARKQRREFLAKIVREGHTLATTTLNIAELYAGMLQAEEPATQALLEGMNCFELSASVGRIAGKLKREWARKGRTLALADTIVAASAIEFGCSLLTDNRRDFPMPQVRLYPLP